MSLKNKISVCGDKASNNFKEYSRQQKVLFFAVGSVCLPFPITCAVLFFAVCYLCFSKGALKLAFEKKFEWIIFGFGLLIIIVPLFYKRYLSSLVGLAILIGIVLFLMLKAYMTASLYYDTMNFCGLTSVACFFIAVLQKLFNGPMFRATGGLFNANYYGTICEFIIIFSVFGLLTNKRLRSFYVFTLLINVAGIFLCDCQSAWIAVIMAIFVLVFFGSNRKVALLFLCGAAVALFVGVFTPGLLPRLDRMPQTYMTRKNIWDTAIKGFLAHPVFGQGALTYMFSHKIYDGYKTYHAHSIYLDPLMSYGIVGTGLALTYLFIQLKNMLKNNIRTVIAVVFSAIAAALIHGITDNSLLWVQTGFLMLFVLSGTAIKKEIVKNT